MSLEEVSEILRQALPAMRAPVLVGMGNEISADDGAGHYVISELAKKLLFFKALDAGTMPENFVSKIATMRPSQVIFIDAAAIRGKPGEVAFVEPGEMDDVISTTHHIPLTRTIDKLKAAWPCEVLVIGIKPGCIDTGEPMTPQVRGTADRIVELLLDIDRELVSGKPSA